MSLKSLFVIFQLLIFYKSTSSSVQIGAKIILIVQAVAEIQLFKDNACQKPKCWENDKFQNYTSTTLYSLATIGYLHCTDIIFGTYKEDGQKIQMSQFQINSIMSDLGITTEN